MFFQSSDGAIEPADTPADLRAVTVALPSRLPTVGLLLAMLLIGTGLRFYRIGGAALWWDEGFSHRWAVAPVGQVLRETATQDFNPPLFYLLLNGWTRLFGDSEAAMRTPSAIASVISIWLTWLIARKLIREREALFATGLMALSVYQIRYAQEARSYGLFMALSLASLYFLLRILQTWRTRDAVAYVIFTTAMFYTHVYALFFFASQCILLMAMLMAKKQCALTRKRTITIALALAVLLVPWSAFVISRAGAAQTAFWIGRPTLRFIARGLERQAGSRVAAVVIFAAVCLAVIQLVGRNRPSIPQPGTPPRLFTRFEAIAVLLALMLAPHVLAIILSDVTQPTYVHRYTIGTMPAMFMLVAMGTSVILRRGVTAALMILIVAVMGHDSLQKLLSPQNVKARELAAYVDANARPDDILLFDGPCGGGANTFDYYSRQPGLRKSMLDWSFAKVNTTYFDRLRTQAASAPRFWLIMLDRPWKVSAVQDELAATYRLDERYPAAPAMDQMVAVKFERK